MLFAQLLVNNALLLNTRQRSCPAVRGLPGFAAAEAGCSEGSRGDSYFTLNDECVQFDGYLPEPCLLNPEQVTEYPDHRQLSKELREQIGDWSVWQGSPRGEHCQDGRLRFDRNLPISLRPAHRHHPGGIPVDIPK